MAEKQALSLDQTKGGSRSDSNRLNSMSIKDDEDANNRQRIRRCILEGDIDQALKYTNAYYPKVLEDNEQVYFRLRCRKFIEMIRKEAELNLLLEKKGFAQKKGGFSNHHHQPSYGDGDDYKEAMMVDTEEEFGPGGDGEAAAAAAAGGVSKLSQEALAYGIELRAEFKEDPRREVHKHLHEIFALIAYQNPLEVKEVAHLLDRKGRVAVAEELNSAILSESSSAFYLHVCNEWGMLTEVETSVSRQVVTSSDGEPLRTNLRPAGGPETGRRRWGVCHSAGRH